MRNTLGFWRHLPYHMCLSKGDADGGSTAATDAPARVSPKFSPSSARCWNGSDPAPYTATARSAAQPRATTTTAPSAPASSAFRQEMLELEKITHQVRCEMA